MTVTRVREPEATEAPGREALRPPAAESVREELCACGGTLWQREHEDVRTVVERHNGSALHRAMREREDR